MSFEPLKGNVEKMLAQLTEKFHAEQNELTKQQFAECLLQAIQCGDFIRLCLPYGQGKIIYAPYAKVQQLEAKIAALEVREGPPYHGPQIYKHT